MRSDATHGPYMVIAGRERKGYGRSMLTALIVCGPDPSGLVATFGALLPSSVAGLTADVIVVSGDPESVAAACEPTGATSTSPDGAAAALKVARGSWVLVLEAGARPVGEWMPVVAAHIAAPAARAARFEVSGRDESFWRRLVGRTRRPLRAGLLLPREGAIAALRTTTPARLPVGRATATLRARLEPAS